MKKLLFLLLALTVSAPAYAQTQTQYYTVPTIAALKAMTTSRPAVVQVVDSNPGIFNLSAGACSAADDIFQVQPTGGTTVCYTRAATPYSIGKTPTIVGSFQYAAPFSGDQTATFNAAMAALSAAGGGTYYMPKGTATVSAAVEVPANVTLQCAANGGTIIKSNSANPGFAVIGITGNYGQVIGCTTDGSATVAGTRGSDGIRIMPGIAHAKILNNTVYGAADNGIEDNGTYSEIVSNYVYDNYTNGIYAIGTVGNRVTYGIVHDNTLINNSKGTTTWDGIDVDPCHDNYHVYNNTVIGNDIIIAGAHSAPTLACGVSSNSTIRGNRIYSSPENGIALLGQLTGLMVAENYIVSPTGWCIYDNTTGQAQSKLNITTNQCTGSTKDGIYIANFVPSTVTITIATPAVVSLTAHGLAAGQIVIFSTTGALPTGITAGMTYYVISAGLTADAVEISETENGAAVNTSGSQSGVQTMTGSGGPASIDIVNNRIENVGATYSGIRVDSGTTNLNISNNVILPGLGAYAIDTTRAADNALVKVQTNMMVAGGSGTVLSRTGQQTGLIGPYAEYTGTRIPSNGHYLPAANVVGVAINSTLVGQWNQYGLGIGAQVPSGFQFYSAGSGNRVMRLFDTSANIAADLGTNGTQGFIGTGTASPFCIYINSICKWTWDASGNSSTGGQITSTLLTGTAPFVVTSTTNVANLNASSLNGATFAAPGAIGGGTPSTITGTSLTGTSLSLTKATGDFSAYDVVNSAANNTYGTIRNTAGGIRIIAFADGHGSVFTTGATLLGLGYSGADKLLLNSTQFYPVTDNSLSLGVASTNRLANIYSVLGNFAGQITSTLATGSAPFVVASTTNVANLNASSLNGATFAAPGAVGSGTPGTGSFTTLATSGVTTMSAASGAWGALDIVNAAAATSFLTIRNSAGTARMLILAGGSMSLRTVTNTSMSLGANDTERLSLTAAGTQFYPLTDNALALGIASTNRLSNIFSVLGTFSGAVTGTDFTGTGTIRANTGFNTNGTAGIASCTVATLGATITITGGLVTAMTGC